MDKRISSLSDIGTGFAPSDLITVVDVSEIIPSNKNKKATIANFIDYVTNNPTTFQTYTGIAGEAITIRKVLMLKGGLIYHFDPTDETNYGLVVGVATSSVLSGEEIEFVHFGRYQGGFSGLTANQIYYSDDTGSLTSVTPATGIYQEVGFAVSTDTLWVRITQPTLIVESAVEYTQEKDNKLTGLSELRKDPVQSKAVLQAIPQAECEDKEDRLVENENGYYRYDAQSTGTETGALAPNDQSGGLGFWIPVTFSGTVSADKIADSATRVMITPAEKNTIVKDKGFYLTEAKLVAAWPVGEDGFKAVVGATDTVWTWDTDTTSWVDSGTVATGYIPPDHFGHVNSNGDGETTINPGVITFSMLDAALIAANGESDPSKLVKSDDPRLTVETVPDDSITVEKLAEMPANTVIGAIIAGNPVYMTKAQLLTLLNVADGATANAKANQAQAEAGTDDEAFMTALKVVQSLAQRAGYLLEWNDTAKQFDLDETAIGSLAGLKLTANIEFTVGAGGDFATLNEAIAVASIYRSSYDAANRSSFTITIRILQGFVLQERVNILYGNWAFVKITSKTGATVYDITYNPAGQGGNLFTFRNCIPPDISDLSVIMDRTGVNEALNVYGININSCTSVDWNTTKFKGFRINLFAIGLDTARIQNSDFDDAFGYDESPAGVWLESSKVYFYNTTTRNSISNNASYPARGIRIIRNSNVELRDHISTGHSATGNSCGLSVASLVRITGGDFRRDGANATKYDIICDFGSIVNIDENTIGGVGIPGPVNTTDDATVNAIAEGYVVIDKREALPTPVAIPSGGSTGQVLKKLSNTDGDVSWQDDEVGEGISVVANLTSTSNTDALAASQGKKLQDEKAPLTLTGALANLNTTDKTNLVAAINEVLAAFLGANNLRAEDIDTLAELNAILNDADVASQTFVNNLIGALANLTTTDKTSLVNAINEVNAKPVSGGTITEGTGTVVKFDKPYGFGKDTPLSSFTLDLEGAKFMTPVAIRINAASEPSIPSPIQIQTGSFVANTDITLYLQYWSASLIIGQWSYIPQNTINNPPTASDVLITGLRSVNGELTGNYTYVDAEDLEDGTTFQWYRADDAAGLNRLAISGATSQTYTLVLADEGKFIQFGVTPANLEDTGSEYLSGYTSAIGAAPTGILADANLIEWYDSFYNVDTEETATITVENWGGRKLETALLGGVPKSEQPLYDAGSGVMNFNATNAKLISNHPIFDLGDTDWTIAGRFKLSSGAASQHILGRWNATTGANAKCYLLGINASGQFSFFVSPDGNASVSAVSATPFTANTEYVFFLVHDTVNNQIKIKVNAETPVVTAHSGGVISTANNFRIGGSIGASGTFANPSTINSEFDLLVFNSALSDADMTTYYNELKTV